eukprot:gene18527-28596_t
MAAQALRLKHSGGAAVGAADVKALDALFAEGAGGDPARAAGAIAAFLDTAYVLERGGDAPGQEPVAAAWAEVLERRVVAQLDASPASGGLDWATAPWDPAERVINSALAVVERQAGEPILNAVWSKVILRMLRDCVPAAPSEVTSSFQERIGALKKAVCRLYARVSSAADELYAMKAGGAAASVLLPAANDEAAVKQTAGKLRFYSSLICAFERTWPGVALVDPTGLARAVVGTRLLTPPMVSAAWPLATQWRTRGSLFVSEAVLPAAKAADSAWVPSIPDATESFFAAVVSLSPAHAHPSSWATPSGSSQEERLRFAQATAACHLMVAFDLSAGAVREKTAVSAAERLPAFALRTAGALGAEVSHWLPPPRPHADGPDRGDPAPAANAASWTNLGSLCVMAVCSLCSSAPAACLYAVERALHDAILSRSNLEYLLAVEVWGFLATFGAPSWRAEARDCVGQLAIGLAKAAASGASGFPRVIVLPRAQHVLGVLWRSSSTPPDPSPLTTRLGHAARASASAPPPVVLPGFAGLLHCPLQLSRFVASASRAVLHGICANQQDAWEAALSLLADGAERVVCEAPDPPPASGPPGQHDACVSAAGRMLKLVRLVPDESWDSCLGEPKSCGFCASRADLLGRARKRGVDGSDSCRCPVVRLSKTGQLAVEMKRLWKVAKAVLNASQADFKSADPPSVPQHLCAAALDILGSVLTILPPLAKLDAVAAYVVQLIAAKPAPCLYLAAQHAALRMSLYCPVSFNAACAAIAAPPPARPANPWTPVTQVLSFGTISTLAHPSARGRPPAPLEVLLPDPASRSLVEE